MAQAGELLFGQIAIQNRMITQADLDRALADQGRMAAAGRKVSIGQVLLDLQVLTADQVRQILAIQEFVDVREKDKAFGQIALSNGFVTESELQQVLDRQKLMWKGKRGVHRIGDIMIEMGFLEAQQRDAILEAQRRIQKMHSTVIQPDQSTRARSRSASQPEVILHEEEVPKVRPAETKLGMPAVRPTAAAPPKVDPKAVTRPNLPAVPPGENDDAELRMPRASAGPHEESELICIRTCPYCQEATPGEKSRCRACGQLSCTECGALAQLDDRFCPDCKAALRD